MSCTRGCFFLLLFSFSPTHTTSFLLSHQPVISGSGTLKDYSTRLTVRLWSPRLSELLIMQHGPVNSLMSHPSPPPRLQTGAFWTSFIPRSGCNLNPLLNLWSFTLDPLGGVQRSPTNLWPVSYWLSMPLMVLVFSEPLRLCLVVGLSSYVSLSPGKWASSSN